MSYNPLFNFNFQKNPGFIDPRWSFTRASPGRCVNRYGVISAVPANTGRWNYNPVTRVCEGLLMESSRTNLLLYSEDFSNAAWTKTSLTVSANSVTSPDGTTNADTLTATGAGDVRQAVTITAGRGMAFSIYAKPIASNFLYVALTDGANAVECWWNVATGATGSNTSGSGTCVYAMKRIQDAGNGWYRCTIEVTTATSTVFTIVLGPAATDGAAPANTNSIYAWGAQIEAETATYTQVTSYIPTTSATATRVADNLIYTAGSSVLALDRGTLVWDFFQGPMPPSPGNGPVILFGGLGNTSGFTDFLYVSRINNSISVAYNYTGAPGAVGAPNKASSFVAGQRYRFGVTFSRTRLAATLDGAVVSATTTNMGALTQVGRLTIGCAPWSASSLGTVMYGVMAGFSYAPHTADDAVLQQLTAG